MGKDNVTLRIPKLDEFDEGDYYCIVTNLWNTSVESDNANLITYGAYISMNVFVLHIMYVRMYFKVTLLHTYVCMYLHTQVYIRA